MIEKEQELDMLVDESSQDEIEILISRNKLRRNLKRKRNEIGGESDDSDLRIYR